MLVGLVIWSDTRERKAKDASDRVDIASCVGLGKAVLFGRGVSPGSKRGCIFARPFNAHTGNTKVDEVCSVRGDYDVVGRDVAVDNAVFVKLSGCFAELDSERRGIFWG